VQAKVESFGKDGGPRFRTNFDENYNRYKSNLCFKGLFEAKQGWVSIRFIVRLVEFPISVS